MPPRPPRSYKIPPTKPTLFPPTPGNSNRLGKMGGREGTTTTTKAAAAEGSVPLVLTDKSSMRMWSRAVRHRQGRTLALVPTMGYLHRGHISLLEEARRHADAVVVSIYVNPGQFAPSEDLSTYPRDFLGDLEKIREVGGVDAVFRPRDLYDCGGRGGGGGGSGGRGAEGSCVEDRVGGHETWVRAERLEKGLCGRSRPVFFRGVATIVCKLFHVVEPDVAVFGRKDYQQWRIIQRMVRDLDFDVQIVGSEIVREDDGLAMSSRNVNLTPEERQKVHCMIPSIRGLKGRTSLEIVALCLLHSRLQASSGIEDIAWEYLAGIINKQVIVLGQACRGKRGA